MLKALDESDMILNEEKCKWFFPEVSFLGHINSAEGSQPEPWNAEKVLEYPTP